jgi:hypothetical protein
MEHTHLYLDDPNWKKAKEQKEFNFGSVFAEVLGHW